MDKRFARRISQRTLIGFTGLLLLGLGGCMTDGGVEEANGGEAGGTSGTPDKAEIVQVAAKSLLPSQNNLSQEPARITGLLQATDPGARAKRVYASINGKKDGKDPFSSLPPIVSNKTPAGFSGVPRKLLEEMSSAASRSSQVQPPANSASRPPEAPQSSSPIATKPAVTQPVSRPTQIARSNPAATWSTAPLTPSSQPAPSPVKSPEPEPTLARGVEVVGVMMVAGVPQAIVKAPHESTSRYVQVGQRLSNGQVLVKRIEISPGADPVVILEQYGMEVSRLVGEKGVPLSASAGAPSDL